MWHRDITWQCVMSSVTDRVPSGGGGSRGRSYSLMSALMKEVIVTTETKWQVITHPNLLNKARLYRAQRDFEVEQNGGILTLSVRRDGRVFVSLNFDVWLYANRFTVNMFNSYKHSFCSSHRNWNSSSGVFETFHISDKLTKLLKVFTTAGGL